MSTSRAVATTLQQILGEGGDLPVDALAYDSRSVGAGSLFFCVPGERYDGHDFAEEAVRRGAVALVVERPLGLGVPEVVVPSARFALPLAASRFYGNPSERMLVVGITGTNGKTTTSFMLRSILETAGVQCGMLGTVKAVVAGEEAPARLTTPEAVEIQDALLRMVEGGDRACVMEVSSHGLALGRVDEVDYDVAVFTNLSRDHLDFHTSMKEYFEVKSRLLLQPAVRPVVNADDPYGRILAQRDGAVTFAVGADADYSVSGAELGGGGTRFSIHHDGDAIEVRSPIHGRHNVPNALAAAATAMEIGVDPASVAEGLGALSGVPGRFERIDAGQDFSVIVDYAHSPSALEHALASAREVATGRVICVFGCTGGRDTGIRAPMGSIASWLSDIAILTTDDPRGEDPEPIAREVRRGMDGNELVIPDREDAIGHALGVAQAGDVVLIAGGGHDPVPHFANEQRVVDDVTLTRRALSESLIAAR